MNAITEEMNGVGVRSEDLMKTPERRSKSVDFATSAIKSKESPVFNYLSNLSPIKSIKPAHMTHSMSPLNFSMFSSLQRHELPYPSRPEFSSVEESKAGGEMVVHHPSLNGFTFIAEPAKEYSCCNNNPGLESKYSPIPYSNDSMALVPLQSISYERDQNMNGAYHDVRNEEVHDWDSLIDMHDLPTFQSLNAFDSSKKFTDRGATFYEPESLCFAQPGEGNDLPDNADNNECYAGPLMNRPAENMDDEHLPGGSYRGTRRRCLVFEMNGALVKHLNYKNSKPESSVLPAGIGLHLNAIAPTPNEFKIVSNQGPSASGRLLIGPNLSVNFRTSNNTRNESLINAIPLPKSERVTAENGVVATEDVPQRANLRSPKKKRHREQAEEIVACKRCNCKKTKCIKLYCECFAAGTYCVEPCACVNCFNKPIHEDTVFEERKRILLRNPLAFAPKVIRGSDPSSEITDYYSIGTPASARHKRGCNCKKSNCLKRYCECYQAGVGCSINCRCEGCKNAFGGRDGVEIELEEDYEADKKNHNNMDSEIQAIRQWIPQPSSSIVPSVMGSSDAGDFHVPPPDFDEQFDAVREAGDEIPDLLLEGSPVGGIIKYSSPNGKRVTPPRSGGGVPPPGSRSVRRLNLDSIPSFPSLTPDQQ